MTWNDSSTGGSSDIFSYSHWPTNEYQFVCSLVCTTLDRLLPAVRGILLPGALEPAGFGFLLSLLGSWPGHAHVWLERSPFLASALLGSGLKLEQLLSVEKAQFLRWTEIPENPIDQRTWSHIIILDWNEKRTCDVLGIIIPDSARDVLAVNFARRWVTAFFSPGGCKSSSSGSTVRSWRPLSGTGPWRWATENFASGDLRSPKKQSVWDFPDSEIMLRSREANFDKDLLLSQKGLVLQVPILDGHNLEAYRACHCRARYPFGQISGSQRSPGSKECYHLSTSRGQVPICKHAASKFTDIWAYSMRTRCTRKNSQDPLLWYKATVSCATHV